MLVLVRERTALDLSGAGWALAGRLPGSVVGALLLVLLPERGLAILLALVVLGGVALTSFGWVPLPHRRNLVVAGAASGVLGTATSIGGPPMALVWQGNSGAELRSTMSCFFLVGSIISIAVLTVAGAVNSHTATLFAFLAPATVLGFLLSRVINRVLDRRRLTYHGNRRLGRGRDRARRPASTGPDVSEASRVASAPVGNRIR